MKIIEKIFLILNVLFFLGILLIIANSGALLAVLGNSAGIFLLIFPIIIGAIFSIRRFYKKSQKLSILEKLFYSIPLFNLSMLLIVVFMSLR